MQMYQILFGILLALLGANSISNSNFNAHIRDYSVKEDKSNLTKVKTLQKEDVGIYTSFVPVPNAIKFKEIPDSALSSSSYSKGLLHHEPPGYILNDYEETPPYGYGYDYQLHEDHHPHDYKHHDPNPYKQHYDHHDSGHHHYSGQHPVEHGYHHKHYDHGLAAKTILWPIAGIALLGAAAALVSNPVLLQLGVVSGRRRRDTEEVSSPEYIEEFKKYPKKFKYDDAVESDNNYNGKEKFKERMLKWNAIKKAKHGVMKKVSVGAEKSTKIHRDKSSGYGDDNLIPVPLIIKGN